MNPFFISSIIPSKYFCDRENETESLIRNITNGNNTVLISPRRMGKSGLIHHAFERKELKDNFDLIYLDILQSSSITEFVYLFGKAVFEKIVPKTTKWIAKFFQTLKSISGHITIDPVSGFPSFSVLLGEITSPQLTLDEIFKFLDSYPKKCVIAIDEFQQITKYPEKNVEAILRTYIQGQNHIKYIFSGSERHLMQEMFLSYGRPFYQSASIINLEPIEKHVYTDFAYKLFKENNKSISSEEIEDLYDQYYGITFYLQKSLNTVYSLIDRGETADLGTIHKATQIILNDNSYIYREILSNLPEKQKQLLYAVALEGKAENITSASFIKKYSLSSSSSVQSAMRLLLEKDFITKNNNKYHLNDLFLALWIREVYG